MESADSKEQTSPTTITKNIRRGALQVVPIGFHGNVGSHEDGMVLCDTGKSHTWLEQELLKTLILCGDEVKIHMTGIHGTSLSQSGKVEITLGPPDGTATNNSTIIVKSHNNLAVGKEQ